MKKLLLLTALIAVGVVVWVAVRIPAITWQKQTSPGELSAAHASMTQNCAACHTAYKGADNSKCISCHANNQALLQRQPTAFHANIGNCTECHFEHQGVNARLVTMDHDKLAQIGFDLMAAAASGSEQEKLRTQLKGWLKIHEGTLPATSHPRLTSLEATLDCAACHSTKDRHKGLFGQACVSCHGTTQWTIAEFQHPSPRSTDCAQCHQAPPSHYMMHFEMVSKKIAAQGQPNECCDGVQVNQCFRCHRTTSWNDIRGVGYYKHH